MTSFILAQCSDKICMTINFGDLQWRLMNDGPLSKEIFGTEKFH